MANELPTPEIINKFVSVKRASDFETTLFDVFKKYTPRKIIETGTYFGTGTTSIIASAIRDLNINNAEFYSIEIRPENIEISAENLKKANLDSYVKVLHGLSIWVGKSIAFL